MGPFNSVAIATMALMLAGSLGLAPLEARAERFKVEAVHQEASDAVIFNLRYEEKNRQPRVRGRVKRRDRDVPVPAGYILVSVYSQQGRLIHRDAAQQKPPRIHRKPKRASYFTSYLPKRPPVGSVIEVEYIAR